MSNGEDGARKGLQRRDFIRLTAAAGAAVPLTGFRPAGPRTNPPPVAPETGDVVDPTRTVLETWQEPWTWRPDQWPEAALDLTVVRRQNPGPPMSSGMETSSLFSFNGISPGPTVRMRGDGELKIHLRNTLELNAANVPVGPCPDQFELTPDLRAELCARAAEQVGTQLDEEGNCAVFNLPEQFQQVVQPELRPGWDLGGHINGLHCAHTTNLHFHGLHVAPDANPDGSHSDNVFLRVIPRADWAKRQAKYKDKAALSDHEHVAKLDYSIRLPYQKAGATLPHPPGTHWYHPHSHGSTGDQVSSGMAGFLVIEGDVDEAINRVMTGAPRPDPAERSGAWDYRERLVFLQRVFLGSLDLDAGAHRNDMRFPFPASDPPRKAPFFRMRPGAVERWRVLNGSVDGTGIKRFMVLDGQFVQRNNRMWRVVSEGEGETYKRRLEPVSERDFETAKLDLHQLAFDGITLVDFENGEPVHRIRDLSRINAGTDNPYAGVVEPGQDDPAERLRALESVYRDGDSLRRTYARPNEVYLANANRTDLLFRAPLDAGGRIFTIFAKEAHLHNDTLQHQLQVQVRKSGPAPRRQLFDVVVAYVHVTGDPVEGGEFDILSLNEHLPPVPPLLRPVTDAELKIPAAEAAITGARPGDYRCRTVAYTGIGGTNFPLTEVPEGFAEKNAKLERKVWARHDERDLLLPYFNHTMAINSEFDLADTPEPGMPRKFCMHDEQHPRVLADTAEEWVLYNTSMTMWSHTDTERFPQPGQYNFRYVSYPISRAEGQRRFHEDPEFQISTRGIDHPFHIHINPMWVTRIDVPDENGELHNILPQPMWMDTASIPRNGGRVVFRSRFEDYVGDWIHHCHILVHEDMGMMQKVSCSEDPSRANYHTRHRAASHEMAGPEVDAIYPRPSLELMFRQNMCFVDANEVGGQVYPGFDITPPKLDA